MHCTNIPKYTQWTEKYLLTFFLQEHNGITEKTQAEINKLKYFSSEPFKEN